MLSPLFFLTRRLSAEMVHPKMGDTGVLVVFAYPKSLALDVVCLKKRNKIWGCLKKTEYHGIARSVRIAMLKMLSKP